MQALILIDIQNDFLPGGSLPVKKGDQIIPIVNALQDLPFDCIIATKDWHPKQHISFATTHNKQVGEWVETEGSKQLLWPTHCVQKSFGSEFPEELKTDRISTVIYKGCDKELDSYSAFFDNARLHATDLETYLRKKGIDHLYFVGLATDYCVKFSVLDALSLGFHAHVIQEGCRGVDLHKGDVEKALQEMKDKGAEIITDFHCLERDLRES